MIEPEKRLHIAHGVQSLDVGGLERIVVDLTAIGIRRGHRVSVICLERPGTLAPIIESAGGRVFGLEKLPGRTPELTGKAATLFRELQPDILHTLGALWYLGAATRIPVLHSEHIDNVGKASGWVAKLKTRILWNRAARYARKFCCVSEDIARSAGRWKTVPKSKLETILNGIETERYSDRSPREKIRADFGIPPNAFVVGTVGRLNEVKRQDLLLRAVASLGVEFSNVRALLVGDGPETEALKQLARTLGLGERVHFAGYQPSPECFYAAMDAFTLTSRLEGLPLALLEACAAGLPVVASAVGGVPKIVIDGETGLLFSNGDVEALMQCLKRLVSDSAAASHMAVAGRDLVREKYSLERMASDYERHYRELIAAE
jgi:glycosyltransferase involved in cell wall biosynthesis